MEVYSKLSLNKNLALGLGYFDGVHLGHKKIIETLVKTAKEKNIKSAVITFKNNPANFFNIIPTLNIQTSSERKIYLENLGVDYLYEFDFEDYKNYTAEEYLKDILIKNFEPEYIIIGYNHTFGKNRKGNPDFLKKNSKKYNYECITVPEEKYFNKKISSTIIRNEIKKGNFELVRNLLGRYFSISGIVQKGDNVASNLGFKTANLNWDNNIVKPKYGVYFGFLKLENETHPALISWSTKPTLSKEKKETLEAHIFNFDKDIYNKTVEISFVKMLRNMKKFNNFNDLKKQIEKDYIKFTDWVSKLQ